MAGQDVGDPARGVLLLERNLGIGMDAMRQIEDFVASSVDGRGQATLGGGLRVGRCDLGERMGQWDLLGGWLGAAPRESDQRSTDSVASATTTSARMNSAIGGWKTCCSRRITNTATTTATQLPRRIARVQSPR